MEYFGEHLLPGYIGQFFTVLSFTASLLATVAFYKSWQQADLSESAQQWKRLGRWAFAAETISVLAVFLTLFYIIYNHYFEYKYAWQHSSRELPFEYLLSCYWEGQEGSFLLWSFWHCVLGWILIARSGKWEAGVMTTISFAQAWLATMLLGIYVFEQKIGTNPFSLLRAEGFLDNAPIMLNPETGQLRADYLSMIKDGQGLNTLLQNYWMVIHPPVLFLGFASTIVPFAYAMAGLLKKDHTWVNDSLSWGSFSAATLGVGIMMGAAWAYESLSFGGYWAWDPVENASLVPWLLLIAGLHTNLIYKHSGYSLKTTYLFYILSFVLVLYSTFLTRSGVLGDTSVHAFTGADMTAQLLAFVLVFFIPALVLFFLRSKHMPTIHKEESTYSREFWMFIGAMVFMLSGLVIIAQTSTPVFNKVFGTKIAKPEDVEFAFNQVQIFVAIIVGLLTAITQYMKWKHTESAVLGKKLLVPTAIALVISLCISFFGAIHYNKHGLGFLAAIHIAIFASVYAVIGNAMYIFSGLNGKWKVAGASIAHVGFGMVLVGILISSAKKDILSWNTTGISILKKDGPENPAENITLFKGVRTQMGKYHVTYERDTVNDKYDKKHFALKFENDSTGETFTLYPDVIKNNKGGEGFAANPDAKHYWNKDIFVYVTSWLEGDKEDTTKFTPVTLKAGDTTFYTNGLWFLNKVTVDNKGGKHQLAAGETAMLLDITVISKEGTYYKVNPGIAITADQQHFRVLQDSVVAQGLVFAFNKIADEKQGTLEIGVKESRRMTDLLTLKVLEFPFINILWLGIVVMTIGFGISMMYRIRLKHRLKAV
ncbi:MAG: cytochrome c biogenesis protein CcsA [Chitinophagaceae bacterium]